MVACLERAGFGYNQLLLEVDWRRIECQPDAVGEQRELASADNEWPNIVGQHGRTSSADTRSARFESGIAGSGRAQIGSIPCV